MWIVQYMRANDSYWLSLDATSCPPLEKVEDAMRRVISWRSVDRARARGTLGLKPSHWRIMNTETGDYIMADIL